MDLHSHLAARLREARDKHPRYRSAASLAERVTELGVPMSRATLSKLEMRPDRAGARPPSLEELLALCVALDTSPLALLLPEEDDKLTFGSAAMDRETALGWLMHTTAPEEVDARYFEFVAPTEVAEVTRVARATGLGLVDMAEHILDELHQSYDGR